MYFRSNLILDVIVDLCVIAQTSYFSLLMVFSTTLWLVPSTLFFPFEPNVSVLRSVVPCPMFFKSEGLPCPRAGLGTCAHLLQLLAGVLSTLSAGLGLRRCVACSVLHVVGLRSPTQEEASTSCRLPPLSYTRYSPIGKTT